MRLLLVEDDEKIASFVEKGLKSSGFAVDLASTGTLGLDYALSAEYDTLIVDIMLPEMDGFELIRQLRPGGRIHRSSCFRPGAGWMTGLRALRPGRMII